MSVITRVEESFCGGFLEWFGWLGRLDLDRIGEVEIVDDVCGRGLRGNGRRKSNDHNDQKNRGFSHLFVNYR
jgi:hypothetical protein